MSKLWLRHQVTVPLVLLASLAVTGWLWQHEREIVTGHRAAQLDSDLRELAARIEQRMAAYAQVVAGVQGLYAAQAGSALPADAKHPRHAQRDPQRVHDRALLRIYFESLQLGADFAGLNGAGLAMASTHAAEGADRVPVLQMEPAVAGNLRWLGVDLLSAAETRDAMALAQHSGRVTITAPLPAHFPLPARAGVAGAADAAVPPAAEAHVAMLAAVMAGGAAAGSPARTLGRVNWVVAPLRVSEMMASLYGEAIPGVDIRIFDGVSTGPQSLLYDSTALPSAPSRKLAGTAANWAEAVEYVVVAGRTWTLAVRSRAGRQVGPEVDRSAIIALAGVGLSLALTALTWALATSRARALAIAGQMTRELQESETRYRYLAQYDELTRLPNRALFNDRLQQALAQARRERSRLALMFIDLDDFKPVNDRLGHAVGDLVLVAVARRMLSHVRESDTVARIGGDEFVVLLPAVREDRDALRVAEKIRLALNEPFRIDGGHSVTISSSTGVAFYPDHGEDGQRLSASADHAMYHAKQSGRDRVSVFQAPAMPLPADPT